MDLKIIESLLALMDEGGLTELVWEKDDLKVRLSRKQDGASMVQGMPVAPVATTYVSDEISSSSEESLKEDDSNLFRSPLVGTFYRRPNPESDNFVEVGDVVKAGDVICIVEAMKVFNEIHAEESGVVDAVMADDGDAVEFDQPLFRIRKG